MPDATPDPARLLELLNRLISEKGYSQQQIAARVGLPSQFLSDLKHGRRPLTELTARRLGGVFGVNYEWLLGMSPSMESQSMSSEGAVAEDFSRIPRFEKPIEGEPRSQLTWKGEVVELAGLAAARAATAVLPYALKFGSRDTRGRLRRGDLILISQATDVEAEIYVVRSGKKLYLARRGDRGWVRVTGVALPATCPVAGHCVGIIWAAL